MEQSYQFIFIFPYLCEAIFESVSIHEYKEKNYITERYHSDTEFLFRYEIRT